MPVLTEAITGLIPGLTAGVRTALPYITRLSLQGTPLGGETLDHLYKGFVPSGARQLSANEIIRTIRASGFGVNRQNALQVIKALKGQVQAHAYIQNLKDGIRPLAIRVPLSGQRQTYKYHVRVLVKGFNQVTGDVSYQYVTVTSTSLISKAQAKSEAAIMSLTGEQYDMTDITNVDVITYTRQNPTLQA